MNPSKCSPTQNRSLQDSTQKECEPENNITVSPQSPHESNVEESCSKDEVENAEKIYISLLQAERLNLNDDESPFLMSTNNLAAEWESIISQVFCISSDICFIGSLSSFDAGGRATGEQKRPADYGIYIPVISLAGCCSFGPIYAVPLSTIIFF